MFSFVGDTVLDPFCGSGTTLIAALRSGRNSVGVEIDRGYCRIAAQRMKAESLGLFTAAELVFEKAEIEASHQAVYVDAELSRLRPARQRVT
jgi:site-specific DNA-methyltransferase (adenine-specific)